MVGTTDRRRPDGQRVYYRCHRSGTAASHPWKTKVAERHLMPWIEAEAARLTRPATVEDTIAKARDDAAILEAKRAGIGDAYAAGAYGAVGTSAAKAAMGTRLAEIDARLADVEATIVVQNVPDHLPLDASPETVNAFLRSIWASVQLGEDLRPIEAEWKLDDEWIAPAQAA
jgi:hypothetical protein